MGSLAVGLVLVLLLLLEGDARASSPRYAGEGAVIRYLVERACVQQPMTALIPRTCRLGPHIVGVKSLRDALLLDIAIASSRGGPAERRPSRAYAIVVLAQERDDIALAAELSHCSPGKGCTLDEAVCSVAVSAFRRLVFEESQSPDAALASELSGWGGAASSIGRGPIGNRRLADLDVPNRTELLAYLVAVAGQRLARAHDAPSAAPPALPAWEEALRIFHALQELSAPQAAEALAGRSIDPRLAGLLSVVASSDRGDVRAAVLSLGYRLPPWTDHWIVDGGISSFRFSPSVEDIGGNFAFGYSGETWGASARASASSYLFTGAGLVGTRRFDAESEGWGFVGVGARSRVEVRGFVGGGANQVRLRNAGTGALAASEEERTGTGRTGLMIGLRWYPSSRFVLTEALGLGAQVERYEAVRVNTFAVATPSDTTWSVRGSTRSRLQVGLIPDLLSARLRLDASLYRTQLGSTETLYFNGLVARAASSSGSTALDVEARVALDVEVFRLPLIGLVPTVHGGFDALVLDTERGTASSFAPLVGIGFRRESM